MNSNLHSITYLVKGTTDTFSDGNPIDAKAGEQFTCSVETTGFSHYVVCGIFREGMDKKFEPYSSFTVNKYPEVRDEYLEQYEIVNYFEVKEYKHDITFTMPDRDIIVLLTYGYWDNELDTEIE